MPGRVKEKLEGKKLKREKAFATPAERLVLQICQCVETEEPDARKLANVQPLWGIISHRR